MVEEISNLIPDYNKKVNMKLENFVVFSSSGMVEFISSYKPFMQTENIDQF